jgi:hypothetical protein
MGEPKNGELWMLVFHEALYFGSKLKESLLCPKQMRAAGVRSTSAAKIVVSKDKEGYAILNKYSR